MYGLRDSLIAGSLALIATPILLASLSLASAQVMTSPNYQIQQDSINFGGGFSSSTSYTLESTAGEVATGDGQSTSYKLRAGYQQLDRNFISLSAVPPVTMAPPIPGITGGTANGTTTVTVTTDSPAGYELSIAASDNPAMQKGGDSIADYAPLGDPDFIFTTGASDAHFGYSPSGADIVGRFKDDGGACNTGSFDSDLACWDGLSIADAVIAGSAGPNVPSGTVTTLHFRLSIGSSVVQASGTYTATTTLTALAI
jgi:hypothetical protein